MLDQPKKWGHDELARDLAHHLIESRNRVAYLNMPIGTAGSGRFCYGCKHAPRVVFSKTKVLGD